MIDIKIKTYPIEGITYLDVDKEITRLDFHCIPEKGVNIKAIKNGQTMHLCELEPAEAVQMAKAILSFFQSIKDI